METEPKIKIEDCNTCIFKNECVDTDPAKCCGFPDNLVKDIGLQRKIGRQE